jgi:hypothetical protein
MADILNKISSVYELAKTFGNADLLKEISELKKEISTLNNENIQLKDQIRKLTEEYDSFTLTPGGFYVDPTGFPYCGAGCRDPLTAKRIPLKPTTAGGLYKCPACNNSYYLSDPPKYQHRGWDPLGDD